MKKLSVSVLSAAIASAVASMAVSADNHVDTGSFNIDLESYYRGVNFEHPGVPDETDRAWAQVIRAEYQSAYYGGIVGFDLSAEIVQRVLDDRGNNDIGQTTLFANDAAGRGRSYDKLFGAVKVNLFDRGVAKYGRMRLDTPLLNDTDRDIGSVASVTEGFYADYNVAGVHVYGIVATGNSSQNRSGFDDYGYRGSKEEVKIVGGSYAIDGFAVNAAYGEQDNYAKQFYADVNYDIPLQDGVVVGLDAQYGSKEAVGARRDRVVPGNDAQLDWWGTRASVGVGNADFSVSYVDVGDGSDWDDASQGWAIRTGGSGSTNYAGYNNGLIRDFNNAGEESIQYKVGYNFSDVVDGLSASALYIDSDSPGNVSYSEYNVHVDYAVPAIKGLGLSVQHGKGETEIGGVNALSLQDTRVMATYSLSVF